MFDTPQDDIRIIGHRGAAAVAPENTLASFRAAAALGVRWVEMDVSQLADGTAVIFHDDALDRCTNGSGLLAQSSWPQVQQLDAGSWFSTQFSTERVPTLSEALAEIQRLGLGLNLEIKHEGAGLEPFVDRVLTILAREWRENDRLLLSSFNHQALQLCQRLAPHLRRVSSMSRYLATGDKSWRISQRTVCTVTIWHSIRLWQWRSRPRVIDCFVTR